MAVVMVSCFQEGGNWNTLVKTEKRFTNNKLNPSISQLPEII